MNNKKNVEAIQKRKSQPKLVCNGGGGKSMEAGIQKHSSMTL